MAKTTKATWNQTPATYLQGQAMIDGADKVAIDMERKWGAGRLRLLVTSELREKFDRQRFLLNAAIWHGDLEAVVREATRTINAWHALDRAAEAAQAPQLEYAHWEVTLADGTVAALVPDGENARHVHASGRKLVIYTLEEIGRILSAYPELSRTKSAFPGAEVIAIRKTIPDPLDAIRDASTLDDTITDLHPMGAG